MTEEECRTVPLEDVLDTLPRMEREQGRRLLMAFLGGMKKRKEVPLPDLTYCTWYVLERWRGRCRGDADVDRSDPRPFQTSWR
jgi:hypothetical protein